MRDRFLLGGGTAAIKRCSVCDVKTEERELFTVNFKTWACAEHKSVLRLT